MNREEFIAKLQMIYTGDKNAIDELVGAYDNLKDINFKQEYELENRMMKIDYLECKVERLNNVLNEIYEFVDWHYKDNKNFFKNKGIGLNYPECDYILKTINELKESDK